MPVHWILLFLSIFGFMVVVGFAALAVAVFLRYFRQMAEAVRDLVEPARDHAKVLDSICGDVACVAGLLDNVAKSGSLKQFAADIAEVQRGNYKLPLLASEALGSADREFIGAWKSKFSGQQVGVSQLEGIAREIQGLPVRRGEDGRVSLRSLGKYIYRLRRARLESCQICFRHLHGGSVYWLVDAPIQG